MSSRSVSCSKPLFDSQMFFRILRDRKVEGAIEKGERAIKKGHWGKREIEKVNSNFLPEGQSKEH